MLIQGIPIERQVRIKEHSRPRVSCSIVHVVLELNELINTAYLYFITKRATDERNKKKEKHLNEEECVMQCYVRPLRTAQMLLFTFTKEKHMGKEKKKANMFAHERVLAL